MSEGFASPSSVQLELEARRMHAAAPPRRLGDLAPAVVLSGFPQGFDLFVGAFAVVLVFPQVFFPALSPARALWAGLAVWAAAYAVAPLGRYLAGIIRRRFGAGVAVTACRFLLGASTAAIAFLPGASSAGPLAIAMLVAVRLGQGLSMGGLADEGRAFRELSLDEPGRTWARATRIATVVLGAGVALVLTEVLANVLAAVVFLDWGWRYPFVLAVPMNVVALFAQLRLITTEAGRQPAGRPSLRLASGGPTAGGS